MMPINVRPYLRRKYTRNELGLGAILTCGSSVSNAFGSLIESSIACNG